MREELRHKENRRGKIKVHFTIDARVDARVEWVFNKLWG